MKMLKSQSNITGHVVSSHLAPGKDRALANALLRMSERTIIQENTKVDNVLYCGEEEPMYGWTNAVPNPRYSEGTRPKRIVVKKKKLMKKLSEDLQREQEKDTLFTLELSGVTSNIDGQYHSYATLRDMYDNYKKTMQHRTVLKKGDIVDPVTFKYIPWNERREDGELDDEEIKLPMLKMAHATQPSKLVEVLEKYMNRPKESFGNSVHPAVEASDMLEYYDKYRWNFKNERTKENASNNRGHNQAVTKRIQERVNLPPIAVRRENADINVKDKLMRYANGAVRKTTKYGEIGNDGRNVFYIKVRGGSGNHRGPETVRLERKRDIATNGGQPVDRWVARVIIKETENPVADGSTKNSSETESTLSIIVPDDRWSRKQGVVAAERERMQQEVEKAHNRQQREQNLKQLRRRLLPNSYVGENERPFKVKHKQHGTHVIPSNHSVVETAKVSMKYDVETVKRKGTVRESKQENFTTVAASKSNSVHSKRTDRRTSNTNFNRNLTIGSDHVTRMLPITEDMQTQAVPKQQEPSKVGRLFLNRGAAIKNERSKNSPKEVRVKLPVLPKQVKIERPSQVKTSGTGNKTELDISNSGTVGLENNGFNDENNKFSTLPVVYGANSTRVLSKKELDRAKSPSSSTFDSNLMLKQVVDTAHFIKKPRSKEAQFIRYEVIPQVGEKSSSEISAPVHKPHHPPHNRNRGQEKIQDMIDHEKGIVNSILNHLNSTWVFGNNVPTYVQEQLGQPGSFKAALNTAIAKAKEVEDNKTNQVPPKLVSSNRGNIVMKRRVVPPIIQTVSPSTTTKQSIKTKGDFPVVAAAGIGGSDEASNKHLVTSNTKQQKTNKQRTKLPATKRHQERRLPRHKDVYDDSTLDNVICSGDVIIRERPTPKLLEHTFAASITSVKPSRRIVNVAPAALMQKG